MISKFISSTGIHFFFFLLYLRIPQGQRSSVPVDKVALCQIQVEAEFFKPRRLTQAVERRVPKVALPKNLWEE